MINICKICGQEFETKRKDAQFCSGACRVKSSRVTDKSSEVVTDKNVTLLPKETQEKIIEMGDYLEEKDPLKRITKVDTIRIYNEGGLNFSYDGISYSGDYYKSIFYKNLIEELITKPISQLEKEGYFIPAWKYASLNPPKHE